MKTTIKLFGIFAAGLLITTSCTKDFLEIENPTGEPLEEYYTTDASLNEALTSAYGPLHWPDWDGTGYNALNICGEIMGEDFWVGGSSNTDNQHWHMLFNFTANANYTLGTLWTDFYSGVKRSNDVIKYAGWNEDNADIPATNIESYKAQARILRAYYYCIMWKYYGNIPFYLENLSNPYTAPQATADEIYSQLIAELEDVIDNTSDAALPMRWSDDEAGHVSKAMAMMLYAEMVMYQNDTARFSKALGYMQQIISSGKYSLNSDYAALWEESGEWCSESIFEINYNDDNAQRDWGTPMHAGGTVLPTLISPNSWPGGDGWDAGGDGWGFLPVKLETYNMYADNDTRRAATCWDVRGVSYQERYQDTHIWLAKYRPKTENVKDCPSSQNLNYNNNLRIYRYSETLLNAAELLIRTNGSTADAKKYLNQVRNRAGLADLDATLDNIIEERHLEFVGEGKRYFDLVRMVGVSESSKNAKNVLVPDSYGYRTNSWTDSKKYIPLAQSELDADPTLVQNNY